jgi:holo-[acyl-carrier-protein] synthase
MVLGVGVDILKIDKLKLEYLDHKDSFVRKVYTLREQEQAMLRDNPQNYYATRFAGKEAVYKALNWSADYITFLDIEILSHDNGQPYVVLNGKVKEHAASLGIREILISLSYDTEYAIAYAIAQ